MPCGLKSRKAVRKWRHARSTRSASATDSSTTCMPAGQVSRRRSRRATFGTWVFAPRKVTSGPRTGSPAIATAPQVARDGGYRDLATVRSSVLGMEESGPRIYGEDNWQGGGFDPQGSWPTSEQLPTPAKEPVLPPDTIEAEGEIEPPSQSPAAETEMGGPATRPFVPPPPRNLPSTAPSNLPAPNGEEPTLDLHNLDDRPAEGPTEVPLIDRESSNQIEPAPLSAPEGATEAPGTASEPEPTTSSVRLLKQPMLAGRLPRRLNAVKSLPAPTRTKAVGDRVPQRSPAAIQLTAATSTTEPTANKPQSSTLRIRTVSSEVPDPAESETLRIKITTR